MQYTTQDVKRRLKEVNLERVIELGGSGLYCLNVLLDYAPT